MTNTSDSTVERQQTFGIPNAQKGAHYSQWGEDLLVAKILSSPDSFYVDVGCNHPIKFNNTYLFYERGWSGLCIDAMQSFGPLYAQMRPRDRFIHSAVSPVDGDVTLYVGDEDALSSMVENKWTPRKVTVRSRPLDRVLNENNVPSDFPLLSLDIEGLEVEALHALASTRYRPRVIIAEYQTIGKINLELQPMLIALGYQVLSVTRCNIIATRDLSADWAIKRQLAS